MDPRSNRGYVAVGRERVTQSTDAAEIAALRAAAPDAKESFEIGREGDAAWDNRWPRSADAPGFRTTMLAFYQVASSPLRAARAELTGAAWLRRATGCTRR